MSFYKKFTFWLPIISLGICIYNWIGYDDKNWYLFLSSPPFWILELRAFFPSNFQYFTIPMGLIYFISILFWLLIGFLWDKSRGKNKR